LTQPTGLTGTITKLALTIGTPGVATKSYDGLTSAVITGTLTAPIGGENVVLVGTGTFNNANVGTGKAVADTSTLIGLDAGNYTLTVTTGLTGDITTAPLAITAKNQSKCYGIVKVLDNTAFTAVGLQNGETVGTVTLTSASGSPATISAAINVYLLDITPSAATGGTFTASNYSITYAKGDFTVNPVSQVGVASSSEILCQNTVLNPITHTTIVATGIATATGLPAGVTAAWSGTEANGLITISGTPTVSGVFNYTITVTGSCGTPVSATGTITVNPTLNASVSISPSASTVCNGITVTFTASPTNGGTTPTYQWYKGATLIAGATASTYSYNPAIGNTDAINVVMTSDASPCLTASPATSNAITIVVNPIKVASVSVAASANPICQGDSVTFTATPTNGGTTPTYKWYNGATVIAGATAATYTYVPTLGNSDAITVKLTSNASPCLSGSPAVSSPAITITVSPTIVASVTEVSGVLVSSALIGNQWVDCATDLDIPGATNQTYTPAVPGDYKVVVTSGGCTATSACTTVLKVNQFDSKSFTYYPNPVNSDLNLSYSKEITSVKVVNILGQVMSSQSINATTAKVEMSSFPAGLYLVEVKSNDESKTIKVMKN